MTTSLTGLTILFAVVVAIAAGLVTKYIAGKIIDFAIKKLSK
jgi:ABC-type dipeptide/oligopeptide/nickel transport system permease component